MIKKRRKGECWCRVFRAISHQTSPPSPPPSLKKQNNVLTSWWRGAEGRAGREGGKLGNQMWSIKTYWHAKGLPLPHSHTESTNSYNRPRCIHVCVHMSHTGRTKPHTHTTVHELTEKYTTWEWPCASNQSMPQKPTSKNHVGSEKKHTGSEWKTCWIWINQCWPLNI